MKIEDYYVYDVPINHIWVDPEFNCRSEFAQHDVQELADSIDQEGLLFPVVIQPASECEVPAGFRYKLVCGFRRVAACLSLDWITLPANVRSGMDSRQAQLLNLQENLERKDLNILEEAIALDKIFPAYRTDTSISFELKRERKWVVVRRKLLILPVFIQQAVASGRLSARDLQAIISHPCPDVCAEELLKAAKDRKKYTVIQKGKQKKNKTEIRILITDMLAEGFHPNILRLLGWTIGEVDYECLQESLRWLRDRKGWLK